MISLGETARVGNLTFIHNYRKQDLKHPVTSEALKRLKNKNQGLIVKDKRAIFYPLFIFCVKWNLN
jgi:hypothetical protein